MAARKTYIELEREKRKSDLERLDELFLRLLGLGNGSRVQGLYDLNERLHRISNTIHEAYVGGLSISEMLDLLDTHEATRELVFQMPELVVHDKTAAARGKIWECILNTKSKMLRR